MSLDIYLRSDTKKKRDGSGIFIRENGSTREISRDEWDAKFPGKEPVVFSDSEESTELYSANITHNLNSMADEAGIYKCLWRPDENGITHAKQLIEPLERGIALMKESPEHFEQFNSPNGWGTYEDFLPWLENLLQACKDYPEATIEVSR